MIYIVAFGVGFKCPHKIHLNTQGGGGPSREGALTALVSSNLGPLRIVPPPQIFWTFRCPCMLSQPSFFGTDYDKSTSGNPLPTFQSLLSHACRMQLISPFLRQLIVSLLLECQYVKKTWMAKLLKYFWTTFNNTFVVFKRNMSQKFANKVLKINE